MTAFVIVKSDRRPVFPKRCIVCGLVCDGVVEVGTTDANRLNDKDRPFWKHVKVPVCGTCVPKVYRKQRNYNLWFAALVVGGLLIASKGSYFTTLSVLAMALCGIIGAFYYTDYPLWIEIDVRPVGNVQFAFRNAEYAREFATMNTISNEQSIMRNKPRKFQIHLSTLIAVTSVAGAELSFAIYFLNKHWSLEFRDKVTLIFFALFFIVMSLVVVGWTLEDFIKRRSKDSGGE
jgi:hypothetical protein